MKAPALPMFPLPDFFLFPGAIAPLHIFEKRYRRMVGDLLDCAGRFVMASIPERFAGKTLKAPPVFPVASLVEIMRHDPLPDGRYLVWVMGLRRARVEEVPSNKPYRQVHIELFEDIDSSTAEDKKLRPRLEVAIESQASGDVALAEDLSIGALADLLLQSLKLTPAQLEEVFPERNATRRAVKALAWLTQAS
jgi:Lon protease-like protein